MRRQTLLLSLSSCLGFAWVAACGTSDPGGSPSVYAGAPAIAGTAGASAGAGGSASGASGGGGAPSAGSAGTDPSAGAGGLSAGTGGTGTAGTGGTGDAGTGGIGDRLPAVPDSRGIYGHPDPNTTYPDYPGFKPYLVEEFNTPIDVNRDPFWTWGDGALFDGQTHMVEKNITFETGKMVLHLTKEGVVPGGYSFSAADNVADKPVSAAEFRSIHNEFRYGRYEVRMKSAPGGSNNFLHTMFVYRAPAYLLWREIDIELTAGPQNNFISNLIVAPAGTRVWNGGIEDSTRTYPYGGNGGEGLPADFNTSTDFHTYAFEWLPTSVKWFVDGKLLRVKLDGQGKNNLVIPKESTKIIMNMWVFGNKDLGGGDPANNVYPIIGEYDWFRYYRWNDEQTYPCADLATRSCLTADDLKWAKNNPKDGLPDVRPPLCTGVTGMLDTACGP